MVECRSAGCRLLPGDRYTFRRVQERWFERLLEDGALPAVVECQAPDIVSLLKIAWFIRSSTSQKASKEEEQQRWFYLALKMSIISLRSSSSSSSCFPFRLPSSRALDRWLPRHTALITQRMFPGIFVSSGVEVYPSTEFDAVSRLSEIVPDTVIFDDFERFPPTAATVTSSLLLGITSLPSTKFKSSIERALADAECFDRENQDEKLSCIYNKALINVGGELTSLVPGRVSTEVDPRLANDTHGIVRRVYELLKLYSEIEVSPERVLFKIPATWQGIEASNLLESEGIQTHMTFVYSFAQAAAAAQAGASVIQIFVGRIRDWSSNHSGDPEIEAAQKRGEDPGLALVTKAYNYIHKHGHKSKLMAAAVRNKQDVFSLLGVEYIIAPLKILQSLKESIMLPDEKYSFMRRLSPSSSISYNFSDEEVICSPILSIYKAQIPESMQYLRRKLKGKVTRLVRAEFGKGKGWPRPYI
ncbi:hypothetical protein KSP39_PZI008294 [Platanthera zijinensis]|uniref:Transaldolase n=1 Tax=Platanthera zijinensis TaxID=2320716 RepID=A0AAP0BNF4_9ASPA